LRNSPFSAKKLTPTDDSVSDKLRCRRSAELKSYRTVFEKLDFRLPKRSMFPPFAPGGKIKNFEKMPGGVHPRKVVTKFQRNWSSGY